MPPQTPNTSLSQVEEQRASWNRPSRNFVMLAVGGGFLAVYFLGFGRPLVDAVRARNWQPTQCTLLESALQERSGDEGTPTFSVAVKYSYYAKSVSAVGAPNYFEGTRYDFQSGSDSDLEHWSKLANSLRPGSACTCYVNPADPSQAVLNMSLERHLWKAIFWSPLAAFPLALPWLYWFEKKRLFARWETRSFWPPTPRAPSERAFARKSRKGGDTVVAFSLQVALLAFIVAALTIVAYFLISLPFSADQHTLWSWLAVPAGILFGAAGILIAGGAILGLSEPRLLLELEKADLAPGQTARFRYWTKGKPEFTHAVRVTLQCNYIVSVGDSEDRYLMYEAGPLGVDGANPNSEGSCLVSIPANGPRTARCDSSRIEWEVSVELIPSSGTSKRASLVFPVIAEPFRLQATDHSLSDEHREKAHPLELQLAPSSPGLLSGQILWDLTPPVSSIDLRLFWYTEGKAYFQAVVLAAETTIATSQSAGQAPFSLRFPSAPTPYRSDSLTIAWALEAIARPSGIVNRVDLRTAEPTASSTEMADTHGPLPPSLPSASCTASIPGAT